MVGTKIIWRLNFVIVVFQLGREECYLKKFYIVFRIVRKAC